MTRSRRLAAFIVSALCLLHSTSAGTIRRKRKYVVVQEDGEHHSQSGRGEYFYRRGNLLDMPNVVLQDRKLKSRRGGSKKRSRAGNYYFTVGDEEDTEADVAPQVSNAVANVDLDAMTVDELEYFFQIERAQSFPETDAPEVSPTPPPVVAPTPPRPTVSGATKQPTPSPTTPAVDPSPTAKATPSPTRRPTAAPVPVPATPSPTRRATPAPTPEPTTQPLLPPTTTDPTENPQTPMPSSNGPIECEDMTRREALLMIIGESTDESTLMDPTTPQAQAYLWMLDEDPARVDPCSYASTLQRYILSVLYFSTSGDSWSAANGWLTEDGECIWLGVNCNGNGVVTRVELRENNLDGTLSPELVDLSSLRRLDVSGNSIRGQLVELPPGLVFLDVERNAMSGSPFDAIRDLTDLQQLHLSSNAFTGEIPTEIGGLESLEELWMANNQFGTSVPTELGNLENLETLFIYNAQLGGSIPSEIGRLDLTELLANNNQFESEIPDELWNNDRLTLLRLDSNQLSGTLSTRVGQVTGLTDLFLNNNNLSGGLPVQLQRLTSLVNVLLNDNSLGGSIRDDFENFRDLDFFDVSSNAFTGTLPSTLFDLRDLRFLYLSNNEFSGTIPENWGNAVLLRDLFLDGNSLTGFVPEIPSGAFARLTELLVNGNAVVGEMPGSICQLRTSAILEDLWADCAGDPPEIQCALPACCTFCFGE